MNSNLCTWDRVGQLSSPQDTYGTILEERFMEFFRRFMCKAQTKREVIKIGLEALMSIRSQGSFQRI